MTPRKPNSFSKEDKVRKRPEYLALYRRCRPMYTAHFVFYVSFREGDGRRFGCTVSKKVGNAVLRTRVKRLLREVFRTHREELPAGVVVVANAKKAAATVHFKDVLHDFRKIVLRLENEGPQEW